MLSLECQQSDSLIAQNLSKITQLELDNFLHKHKEEMFVFTTKNR